MNSLISDLALARARAVLAERKCRSQLKPFNMRAHSYDGAAIPKGERPCALTIFPPKA
jgi:hypothetical protein